VLLVADASVLVSAVADFRPTGDAVRSRLVRLELNKVFTVAEQ